MKPQVPPPQFSCVQVPYSEATEAHDTESLAWGHPPPGVSMEIAHQVSRALNPDHKCGPPCGKERINTIKAGLFVPAL